MDLNRTDNEHQIRENSELVLQVKNIDIREKIKPLEY
jgi:hypothetical protein